MWYEKVQNFGMFRDAESENRWLHFAANLAIFVLTLAIIPLVHHTLEPRFGEVYLIEGKLSLATIYAVAFAMVAYVSIRTIELFCKQWIVRKQHTKTSMALYYLIVIAAAFAFGKVAYINIGQIKQVALFNRSLFDAKYVQDHPAVKDIQKKKAAALQEYNATVAGMGNQDIVSLKTILDKNTKEAANYRFAASRDTTGTIKALAPAFRENVKSANNLVSAAIKSQSGREAHIASLWGRVEGLEKRERALSDSLLTDRASIGAFDGTIAWAVEIFLVIMGLIVAFTQMAAHGTIRALPILVGGNALPIQENTPQVIVRSDFNKILDLKRYSTDLLEKKHQYDEIFESLPDWTPSSPCPQGVATKRLKKQARAWLLRRVEAGLLQTGDQAVAARNAKLTRMMATNWVKDYRQFLEEWQRETEKNESVNEGGNGTC